MSILELALLSVKPSVLSTISTAVRLHLNEVLYRTIILSSPQTILALHYTAVTSPHLLLGVKKLISTYDCQDGRKHVHGILDTKLREIVGACKNMHTLTLRDSSHLPNLAQHHYLEEFTVPSFAADSPSTSQVGANAVKRLRFAEPIECGWASPCEMLAALGNLEGLTHLQLSRRAGANEDNDNAFRDDIATILEDHRELKMLVVSVYKGHSWQADDSPVQDSHLWKITKELKDIDDRIVILEGQRSEWRNEHDGYQPGDHINSRFWATL